MILWIYYIVILSIFAKYAFSESTRKYLFMNGPCLQHQFRCLNDNCVDRNKFCNGKDDCGDNSDEKYCNTLDNCPTTYEFFPCPSQQLNYTKCVPALWQCDGSGDCSSRGRLFDEENCGFSKQSKDLEFITSANVSVALKRGRNWIINQRKRIRMSIDTWGEDLPKKVVALYLASPLTWQSFFPTELIYELSLSFLSKLLSKKISDVPTHDLASYLNAFLVSCVNARNFFDMNLVQELRKRVDNRNTTSPFALLALCNAGETITERDVRHLLAIFSRVKSPFTADIQAYVIMALSCAVEQNTFDPQKLSKLTLQLKTKQYRNGTVDNVKTTALVLQALFSSEQPDDDDNFVEREAILQLMRTQKHDGDFGGISNSYYILPVLAYSSLVNISTAHCPNDIKEKAKNKPSGKWNIKYSLWIGDDKSLQVIMNLNITPNTSFLRIMEYAANLNPNYRFEYSMRNKQPYIFSISGIMDDPEAEKFWTLHRLVNETTQEVKIFNLSPAVIFPNKNDHFVFWYRSIYLRK